MWKKLLLSSLVVLIFCLLYSQTYAQTAISIKLENGFRQEEKKVYIFDSAKYLNVRDLADILGVDLKWYSVSKKVELFSKQHKIEFIFNSTRVKIDNKRQNMSRAAKLLRGNLYIPLNFITDSSFEKLVEFKIDWDETNKILKIHPFPNITGLRYNTAKNYTRLVLDLKDKLYYEINKLSPTQLQLEIFKGVIEQDKNSVNVNDNLIKSVEFSQEKNKALITIEAETEIDYKVYSLNNPYRLVIDAKSIQTTVTLPKPEAREEVITTPQQTEIVSGETIIKTVVIDPGHGGKDPGAIGPGGTKEKDVNLELALKLAQIIKERTEVKVILTRKEDVFIPLALRTKLANDVKADLFISVHCNAGLIRNSNGFEIYFLSDRASDEEAEAVANIENSVIDLEDNSQVNDSLKAILWSMTLNEFMNQSSELCSLIADKIVANNFNLVNRGVRQAGFHVLRGAKMPAILVEAAFISYRPEERLLNNKKFQNKMAEAIFCGIMDYELRKRKEKDNGQDKP